MCASAPPSSARVTRTTIDASHHHNRRVGIGCRRCPVVRLVDGHASHLPTVRKHTYRRPAPQLCKQHQQVVMRERDAACRRRVAWARKMHEDGAAPPLHARAVVVTENENQIVEIVVAGQAVGARSRRQFDEPIVVAVGWILAPAIVGPNGAQRKYRPRPRHTIGAIEHLTNGKASERCRAVAFPLQRLDAAPAERRTPHAMRQDKAPFPWISGCAPQRDVSLNSHGQLAFFLLG